MNIKIATYNISHCQDFSITTADDAPVDMQKYGKYLQELNADIIALNEVYLKGNREEINDQTEKLKTLGNYAYAVEGIGYDFGWATIGNAILSRYPIESLETVPVLTPTETERREGENEWYEDRIILSAVVDIKGEKLRVIATHFGLNGLEKERMLNALCPLIDRSEYPVVLLGDFNTKAHSEVLLPLYERLKSCADEVGNTEYTFSSFNPYITIDYIFVSKEIKVKTFETKKEVLSDHRALTAEISF